MTQQEAYKILGITEEEIEAAGAVPEGKEAAGASTETSQSFDNAFQNFNRQAVERLIKKKYRQAHIRTSSRRKRRNTVRSC